MKTLIDSSRIMTAGMFVLVSPLSPWAMVVVLTAGMIYSFRGKRTPPQGGEPPEKPDN
jgi:4-hydroxybenzoate polyprenyltransferase